MKGEIIERLCEIELENNITILYACESGSRAWGFDNAESDYDVRFIFMHNDLKDYLKLSNASEVIDFILKKREYLDFFKSRMNRTLGILL